MPTDVLFCCFQELLRDIDEEDQPRGDGTARLRGFNASVRPNQYSVVMEGAAETLPALPTSSASAEAFDRLALQALTCRVEAMLTGDQGPPRPSGEGPVTFTASRKVVQDIVKTTETFYDSAPGLQGRRRYINIQRAEWGTTPHAGSGGVETPTIKVCGPARTRVPSRFFCPHSTHHA